MGYEDVDYCLRAWQAGFQVVYAPSAQLHHHESITRGTEVGERERRSQTGLLEPLGAFFDERRVLTDDGKLRVVYVTEDTIVGGGHRDVFEHLNGLVERGHDAQLWTLGDEPDWFDLRCPVRSFDSLRRARRGARAARGDQGGDVVEHLRDGVARQRPEGPAGLLRPGHRDELLPRRSAAPLRGAELLPPGVPIRDDLGMESRAAARAWTRGRR